MKTDKHAVRRVHAIQTGWGEQHPEHRYGTRAPTLWWVLTSRLWVRVPVLAYAIEHRDGLILFDTGLDPAIATDPSYIDTALGRFLLHRIFKLDIGPDDSLERQLQSQGLEASQVHKALLSHLHFDHIGGIGSVPQADLLVSEAEWARLSQPHPEQDWILREHIELPGARWRPITFTPCDDPLLAPFGGCHDVMGDGSLHLLPTPGHTAGSMSLLIRSAGLPPMLLLGDLTYELEFLMDDRVPGVGDGEVLRASFAKVRALKQALPDLVLLPSHDMHSVERLAACQSDDAHAASKAVRSPAPSTAPRT